MRPKVSHSPSVPAIWHQPQLKLVSVAGYSWEVSIDLSKATKLKDVTFILERLFVAWVTSTLETITSTHTDLREVSIEVPALSGISVWPIDAEDIEDETWEEWADLDCTLIQLWESHAVRTKVKYPAELCEQSHKFTRGLLPEATKRGIVELVDTYYILIEY